MDQNLLDVKGRIFNIQRFSIHDGPGIRTTVFFSGCPLRCLWCHNPESHRVAPEVLFSPEKCIGCGMCARQCPVDAITKTDYTAPGKKKPALAIDAMKCAKCGACIATCKFGAISKQ